MTDELTTDAAEALELVVSNLAAGEVRDGQRNMTVAVSRAIESQRHLIAQAGTGTGKSLAYLVPAIRSGKKVVVATATKALQDQLAGKDLPFLSEHMDEPLVWSVLKGRSNYLCKQRLDEMERDGEQLELDDGRAAGGSGLQIRRIVKWSNETTTGDRAELDFEPLPRVWSAVSVGPMECPGKSKCPRGDDCFSERAREAAHASSVIVVNLHLYGLNLASGGYILPAHDVVVIDEAHQFEDVLSSAAGLDFGAGRFASLARNSRAVVGDDLSRKLADLGGKLADLLGTRVGDRLRSIDDDLMNQLNVAFETANQVIQAARSNKDDQHKAARERILIQGGHFVADLDMIRNLPKTHVAWIEGPGHNPSLRLAPIDVAEFLDTTLWNPEPPERQDDREPPKPPTVILTSATLDNELDTRLGLEPDSFDRIDVGSPFDYEHQSMLYCAMDLPRPTAPNWLDAISDELVTLIEAAGGRTLALFTSWKAMDHVAARLADEVEYRVMTQRDLPKPALVREFMADETSVLCATMGFWQGVDIPGAALRLVAIDRLPFPRPDDPLLEARREKAGPAAFGTIDLPRTATMLAQGAGRLIRTANDRGVVAVLDQRLGTARYRWDLVKALPPMKRTRHRSDVVEFLRSLDQPR
ncbi:MAG: ATP-dependent DNA helicase [Acidimicrobiales bacterium]